MTVRPVTDQEVTFFHDNGWVHLPRLVDANTVRFLLGQAEKAFAGGHSAGAFGPIVDRNFQAFVGEKRDSVVAGEMVLSPVMGRNIGRLLELPRVRLLADGYMLKMPEAGGAHDDTLYHQDFPGNPVDRSSFLTVWIALHDMPAEAGVMQFYNRSHTKGVYGQVFADGIDLRQRCAALKDADLSPPLNLTAGDATVHHSLTVHGAPPNRTANNRWAYNILYMDADSRYTSSPGLFPAGVTIAPFAVLDHPVFPLLPMG
jgi:hypothetical protein